MGGRKGGRGLVVVFGILCSIFSISVSGRYVNVLRGCSSAITPIGPCLIVASAFMNSPGKRSQLFSAAFSAACISDVRMLSSIFVILQRYSFVSVAATRRRSSWFATVFLVWA